MYLHPGNKLGMNIKRKSYPSDVSDEEWAFCASYLTLMTEAAPQRVYPLREIFNAEATTQQLIDGIERVVAEFGRDRTRRAAASRP